MNTVRASAGILMAFIAVTSFPSPDGAPSPRERSASDETEGIIGTLAPDPTARYELLNVGSTINSRHNDYAPCISRDGLMLYFVSDRGSSVGGHDIWAALKLDKRGLEFGDPTRLPKPVNTDLNEGAVALSSDGATLYFTACDRLDGLGDCDIYSIDFDGANWSNHRAVEELNSPDWDSQPTLSLDGRTIYFASTRPGAAGGPGDADIWYSTIQSDGRWGRPRNMGRPINTRGREDSPCILRGDSVFYFASTGHGGDGGFDYFASIRQPDGRWGEPVNLGNLINSPRDERFLTATADGDVLYYSSERTAPDNEGKLDIFMIRRLEEAGK